jgi:transcriptional regulator with XRE-family HTH domain
MAISSIGDVEYAMAAKNELGDQFGERLKKARENRKIGQAQLAESTGLPPSSISHFEAGSRKPSFDNLRRIAGALDVSTDFLLGRVDEMTRVEGSQRLHRHLGKLSDQDLKLADDFIAMLADRDKGKREKS